MRRQSEHPLNAAATLFAVFFLYETWQLQSVALCDDVVFFYTLLQMRHPYHLGMTYFNTDYFTCREIQIFAVAPATTMPTPYTVVSSSSQPATTVATIDMPLPGIQQLDGSKNRNDAMHEHGEELVLCYAVPHSCPNCSSRIFFFHTNREYSGLSCSSAFACLCSWRIWALIHI